MKAYTYISQGKFELIYGATIFHKGEFRGNINTNHK